MDRGRRGNNIPSYEKKNLMWRSFILVNFANVSVCEGTSSSVSTKDKAGAKQLKWEQDRNQVMQVSHFSQVMHATDSRVLSMGNIKSLNHISVKTLERCQNDILSLFPFFRYFCRLQFDAEHFLNQSFPSLPLSVRLLLPVLT